MIKINDKKQVNAKDIYAFVEVKTPFHKWVKRCIDYSDAKENKDFWTVLSESTGGRPEKEYLFTVDAAKEMCIVSHTSKAKELRRWLISLSEKTENLELITVKQAAFAVKVINCLKYIENQKEAYSLHKNAYCSGHEDNKYIFAEFSKYREKITGWNKEKVDNAINDFLSTHSGYNRNKLMNSNMQTKHSAMDISEAIRVAVLDILYSKNENEDMAQKFSNLCKRLAVEMKIEPEKGNNTNLFRSKEQISDVKNIAYELPEVKVDYVT